MKIRDISIVLIVPGIIIACILVYIVFLWATYIDVRVQSGEAYGFNIGDSKMEAFQDAKKHFSSQNVYILYPLNQKNYGPFRKVDFSEEDFSILLKREAWELFFKKNFFDFLALSFKNEKLISIYRHRQKFELP